MEVGGNKSGARTTTMRQLENQKLELEFARKCQGTRRPVGVHCEKCDHPNLPKWLDIVRGFLSDRDSC